MIKSTLIILSLLHLTPLSAMAKVQPSKSDVGETIVRIMSCLDRGGTPVNGGRGCKMHQPLNPGK